MFVEMHRAGELVFKFNSDSAPHKVYVCLNAVDTAEPDRVYGQAINLMSRSHWAEINLIVANLLPVMRAYVWDAYVQLIDHDVQRLRYIEVLFSSADNFTGQWEAAGEISDAVWDHTRDFGSKQSATYHALWDGIAKGIQSREEGVKGEWLDFLSL